MLECSLNLVPFDKGSNTNSERLNKPIKIFMRGNVYGNSREFY